MAKGGGKNAILLIIAVAAIGGAIYGIMSMKQENPQYDQMVYWIDPESVMKDPQVTASHKASETLALQGKSLVDDPAAEERLVKAGVCGHCGKYYPLIGHGQMPENCPVCKQSLAGFDTSGNRVGG